MPAGSFHGSRVIIPPPGSCRRVRRAARWRARRSDILPPRRNPSRGSRSGLGRPARGGLAARATRVGAGARAGAARRARAARRTWRGRTGRGRAGRRRRARRGVRIRRLIRRSGNRLGGRAGLGRSDRLRGRGRSGLGAVGRGRLHLVGGRGRVRTLVGTAAPDKRRGQKNETESKWLLHVGGLTRSSASSNSKHPSSDCRVSFHPMRGDWLSVLPFNCVARHRRRAGQ